MKTLLRLVASAVILLPLGASAESKKLKVFILAGQSNMEGHARIETFDYIGDDPATAPLLKQMRGADGEPAVADHTWISYLTGHHEGNANGEGGVDGLNANDGVIDFRKAMAAPAQLPEFKGNVMAVETAPFWPDELDVIDKKRGRVKLKNKNTPNKDGTMDMAAQDAYLKKFEADLISPEEAALWVRGASNVGYHYMGCAKTFALMGKAFAEANLTMMKGE